jgi:hypothetical protein
MADTKISDLTAGGAAQAADAIPVARAGGNVKVTAADIAAAATAVGTLGSLAVTGAVTLGGDVGLFREAGDTLAQQRTTNAQAFRLYNTFTDASNYERLALRFATHSTARYALVQPETAGTGAADIGLVLGVTGTGAITAQMPDGTTAGGNARGAGALDFSRSRTAATQVASGQDSVCFRGTASGGSSVAFNGGTASGSGAYAFGSSNVNATASGSNTVCWNMGGQAIVSGSQSFSIGQFASVTRNSVFARSSARLGSSDGSVQAEAALRGVITTDATPTDIVGTNRLTLVNHGSLAVVATVIARTNTAVGEVAMFRRQCLITRGATAASTALVGTVQTIGTDIGSNGGAPPAGWDVTLAADTTNGSLLIEVTGAAATNIRWTVDVQYVQTIHLAS